jgi:hypothetical protein
MPTAGVKTYPPKDAPPVVVLSVDGSMLGMQVRQHRRRRQDHQPLPPLPPVEEGQFQEVKTGVLRLPKEIFDHDEGNAGLEKVHGPCMASISSTT